NPSYEMDVVNFGLGEAGSTGGAIGSAEDLWGSLTQCAPFDKLRATLGDGVLSFSGHRMVAAGIGNEWKACCLLSAAADTDIGPNLRDEWQIVMRTKVG